MEPGPAAHAVGPGAPAAVRPARRAGRARGVAQALSLSGPRGRPRRLDVRNRRGAHRAGPSRAGARLAPGRGSGGAVARRGCAAGRTVLGDRHRVLRAARVFHRGARRGLGARHSPRRIAGDARAIGRRSRSAEARSHARDTCVRGTAGVAAGRAAHSLRARQEAAVRRAQRARLAAARVLRGRRRGKRRRLRGLVAERVRVDARRGRRSRSSRSQAGRDAPGVTGPGAVASRPGDPRLVAAHVSRAAAAHAVESKRPQGRLHGAPPGRRLEMPPGPEGVFWWRSDYF